MKLIDGNEKDLPDINESNDMAKPFIEIDRYGYNYVVRERGIEYERTIPPDLKELLYLVFRGITFDMASTWEVKNRKKGQDTRRLLFAKQIELLDILSPDFGRKAKAEMDSILRIAPYDDGISND